MESNGKRVMAMGLAIGKGTGPELADVFKTVLLQLASHFSLHIDLHQSSRIYHSYQSLVLAGDEKGDIYKETLLDAAHYQRFCEEEAARGTCVIFRTAITAQSLYLVRQHLEAIKVELFTTGSRSLLLVRDQAQGFYTGSNEYDLGREIVSRTCQFGKDLTGRIISYSLNRARQIWNNHTIDSVIMIYKHHIFDGVFDTWAKAWSEEHAVKVEFVQPDTANRNLLMYGIKGHQLMIAGNEYADIMQVFLLNIFDAGVQETSYAENVYLHQELNGLIEYQTVHGSADDLTGKGTVNPTATIKAAGAILDRHGRCRGVEKALNSTINRLVRQNIVTPDQGGSTPTSAFVKAVLDDLIPTLSPSKTVELLQSPKPRISSKELSDMGMKTCLIIIDLQNDFDIQIGTKTEVYKSSPILRIASNIERVANLVRAQHREVIFVRFLGDKDYQLPSWQYRDYELGRETQCITDTWGADFVTPVKPVPGERVFEKKAAFDSFFCDGFEKYLRARGLKHLILVGLYGDVCVDSTARTAFQKGYYTTMVSDCVETLHIPRQDYLNFAGKVYGTRIITHDELLGMASSERQHMHTSPHSKLT